MRRNVRAHQVRKRIRFMNYSLKNMRHPRNMGGAEVQAFLQVLANEQRVAV